MRFVALILLAAALGVASSLLVACGGSNNDSLIPGRDAEALKRYADRVGTAAAQQDCAQAAVDVGRAIKRVGALPATVDADLRANLEDGFNNLERQVETKCAQTTTDTTTTDTTTTDTTPTETTDTTTTDTTTTDTTTTDTTTTDTTTTDTTPTDGNGTGGSGSGGQSGSGGGDQGGTPPGGTG